MPKTITRNYQAVFLLFLDLFSWLRFCFHDFDRLFLRVMPRYCSDEIHRRNLLKLVVSDFRIISVSYSLLLTELL